MSAARDGRQRLLNGIALLLVVAGVAIYYYAWWRMNRVAGGQDSLDLATAVAQRKANLDQYYALRDLSRIGIGVTAAGVVTMFGAAIRHSLRTRRFADHGLQDRT